MKPELLIRNDLVPAHRVSDVKEALFERFSGIRNLAFTIFNS